jgi:hypothetical protein
LPTKFLRHLKIGLGYFSTFPAWGHTGAQEGRPGSPADAPEAGPGRARARNMMRRRSEAVSARASTGKSGDINRVGLTSTSLFLHSQRRFSRVRVPTRWACPLKKRPTSPGWLPGGPALGFSGQGPGAGCTGTLGAEFFRPDNPIRQLSPREFWTLRSSPWRGASAAQPCRLLRPVRPGIRADDAAAGTYHARTECWHWP